MRHLVFILLSYMFLFQPLPAWTYWEHASIATATRLIDNKAGSWESCMIIANEVIYPIKHTIPAGFHAFLYVLNVSDQTVYLRRDKPDTNIKLRPGSFKKVDFGILEAKKLNFILFTPVSEDIEDDHHVEPVTMSCTIEAHSWPGQDFIYRAAILHHNGKNYPEKLRLPSNKLSEVFIGSSRKTKTHTVSLGPYKLSFNAKKLTMTEFKNPKGGLLSIQDKPGNLVLDIR